MNIPVWLAERFTGQPTAEPPDGAARLGGAVREVAPTESGLRASAEGTELTARFVSDAIVEVRIAAADDLALPSFSRLTPPLCAEASGIQVSEGEEGWTARSAALNLRLGRDGTHLSLASLDGATVFADDHNGTVRTPRGWRAQWHLEAGARIYGLGAKTGRLDRRGRRTVVWACDRLVGDDSDPLYASVPFFLVARGGRWTGVLLDSATRSVFDFGHTAAERLSFGPTSGALVYLVFAGPTLAEVLEQYTAVTGRMPLPPRWSLGHHQSRYSYNDENEVREIAAEFRRRDIPTDAIHLDIHYMRRFRVFTFHPKRFPHPRQLADDLAKDGFRLVSIVDPGVKRDKRWQVYREGVERGYFTRSGNGVFTAKVWPGDAALPDFCRAEVRAWWGALHGVYTDAGIAGIWNDMNEPAGWSRAWFVGDGVIPFGEKDFRGALHRLDDGTEVRHESVHNAYGHLENRATYEGLLKLRPGERPFILTRAAFAGTQRYAAQWTGDVLSTWSALRQSLPMMMGVGLSGQPLIGSDIGGFVCDSTPELYARWMQIGALAPFCRSHTSLHTHRQEPWSFGARVEAIARAAIKLRYQLLPYLYTELWKSSRSGMPLWRPLFAEFPDDEAVLDVEDQVMVGASLMAAPVVEEGATSRRVVLPRGTWFDWYSGEALEGGGAITVAAPLERMPLFVRGNVAIPTQPEVRFADDQPEHPLIWEVFLASPPTGDVGCVYEDDGHSFGYRAGDFRVTRAVAGERGLHFRPEGWYPSRRGGALVRLYGPARVLHLDGQSVDASGPIQMPHDAAEHLLALRWD